MKRFALLLLPVFAVLLMSHNASAAQRVGSYVYGVSNMTGFPSNSTIVNNRLYNVSASNSDFYVANGQWSSGVYWMPGQEYHLSVSVVVEGSGLSSVVPEALNISEDHYRSTGDIITSSVSCPNSVSCKWTVIHDITLVGVLEGTEVIKTPNSNILNAHTASNFSGTFVMAAMLFTDTDEWRAWRDGVEDNLGEISSNTSDTVDILDQIYDRLDVLDSNADANAQAWDNMQDTDGLIDVGDNQSFMNSFNSVNNFFGGLKNKVAGDCNLDGDLGVLDLGTLNLCNVPQNIKDMVGTISGVVFAVFDIFIVWNSIHYIVSVIDWARRN